jgi:hypothetical protein
MYKDGFVVSIMRGGRPLRESGRTVRVPFGSEYKIRLKNKNDTNCRAVVTIDGTPVSQMGDFVISPGGTLDLERFVTESLDKGKKFKFVSVKDSKVQDPTNSENGIIRVEFYRAQNGPLFIRQDWTWHYPPYVPPRTLDDDDGGGTVKEGRSRTYYSDNTAGVYACNVSQSLSNDTPVDKGATIEGGDSHQSFQIVTDFQTESTPVIIELELKSPIRRHCGSEPNYNYCGGCGSRRRHRDNFCPGCGQKHSEGKRRGRRGNRQGGRQRNR